MRQLGLIDKFLNETTMYRLALGGLMVITVWVGGLSLSGALSYDLSELGLSFAVIMAIGYLTNQFLVGWFGAAANTESALITALILFLIMPPAATVSGLMMLSVATVAAMVSKYLIAPRERHIFNPAAFGAAFVFFLGLGGATWWVANPMTLPAVLIVGLLIVRKIRRLAMFLAFLVTSVGSVLYFNQTSGVGAVALLTEVITSWPLIFLGTIMLTEPMTTPPTKGGRLAYGVLVGWLFGSQWQIGPIVPTPELALLVGNVFSYLIGFKQKLILTLEKKREIARGVTEFIFKPSRRFNFKAGQYLEFTLSHRADDRGRRRYFTIASAPTEAEVKLGVKTGEKVSSFKKALLALPEGEKITAGQLAGDFTLPRDEKRKLAWLAGGIGVTPFRSMAKYLLDTGQKRQITMFYAVKEEAEIVYRELFREAEKIGLETEYVIGRYLDEETIRKKIPDFKERIFYISGPEVMVESFRKMLIGMGVKRLEIKTDYFPGFA